MPSEPNFPPRNANSQTDSAPQTLSSSPPPVIGAVPPLVTGSSQSQSPVPGRESLGVRQLIAILLNVCLGLFLVDAVVSLLDDSLILFFDIHLLGGLRGMVVLFTILIAILTYGLMGLTPMIPKRFFLPVTLFSPVALLVGIQALIYCYDQLQQVAWCFSLSQVFVGLIVLRCIQGGFRLRWPLMAVSQVVGRVFSWPNLSWFLLVNLFVLVPVVAVYLALCATLAVDRFSDGFVALRPVGLTVQVRKYVRPDGKTIQLFPMAHVGDPAFYRTLSDSFQANSTILLEGVTDNQNLLTNKITYKRMAKSLGLSEQQKDFKPSQGELVQADVDVEVFSSNTIDFMNLVMLLHARGVSVENVLKLMRYSPPPRFNEQLFDDLLEKRNQHLLKQMQSRLSDSDNIVVPGGAAHMPGIAREIQKAGFHLDETQEFVAIRFQRSAEGKSKRDRKVEDTGETN